MADIPKIFAALVCVLATGCSGMTPASAPVQIAAAPTPDLAAIKAERDNVTDVYIRCLLGQSIALDDFRSDPGTIAQGAMAACSKEFDADVEAYSRYLEDGLQGRETVARSLRQTSTDQAIRFVLKHRASTRKH